MYGTKYVEDWTAKHFHYSSQDTASLSRRKLPPAPGNSESTSGGRDASYDNDVSHTNTNMKGKTNNRTFERFRTLSMPKRNSTSLVKGTVKTDKDSKESSRDKDRKRDKVIRQSLKKSGEYGENVSAPNSARSESSGYQSRLEAGIFSTRRKPLSSSSLSKTPSRSNSSLTSYEADFQAWKRRKEYKPFNSSLR